MSKKKMTRLGLDELAKVMPVLTEEEAAALVGGDQIFDRNGNYLGQIGSSQEIRLMDRNAYNEAMKNPSQYVSSNSVGLSGQSVETMDRVMKSIAGLYGIDSGLVSVKSVPGWTDYGSAGSNGILLNYNSPSFEEGCNMYDFMATIAHENFHMNDKKPGSTAERELRALKDMQSGSFYQHMSKSYRETIESNIRLYEQELENNKPQ